MSRSMVIRAAWSLAAALLAAAVPAQAHPSPFSYIDVDLRQDGIAVTVVAHAFDLAHDLKLPSIAPLLDAASLEPHRAAVTSLVASRLGLRTDGVRAELRWLALEPLPDRQSVRVRAAVGVARPPGVVSVNALMFPYDPVHQTFVNVYEHGSLRAQAILDSRRTNLDHFPGTSQGRLAVLRKFAASGVHHILIGPDHLLFLVGLLLLGGPLRKLILVVSAFTLAHSVTLSLAALSVISPPASIVEPAIALSIVYVGADNLLVRGGRDLRGWIAFGFGLVHGFGFASVLREMGLPPQALGWSLFAFNLGVEIGQLLVVVAVAWLLAAVRARSETAGRRLAVAGSIVVIAAGSFWFVERVF